jgi:nicotinate phosphoribosyltransferase
MNNTWGKTRNLSMLMDFYELTMSNGYLVNGLHERVAVFDLFFRSLPDNAGFAIFAGLEQFVDYLRALSFTGDDIEYLRSKKIFDERFLEYLRTFEFSCDVWAMREGSPMFPGEPVIVVRGPVIQAQMLETMALLTINHQSMIATKANRIVRAAQGRPIMEFGARRAQGGDASVYGARAAFIGGCKSSSNTIADRDLSVPATGTMAHSWVQSFDSELDAFRAYAETYPQSCTLLVDTYNTLKSGIPNAIRVFDEVLRPKGRRPRGIRIDSGDIAYLSKKARKMLDDAGYGEVSIIASTALDEYIIRDLLIQGAEVDSFGVGESLITSKSSPVMGGVYKLVAMEKNGGFAPKIKVSETLEKITTPGFKTSYRVFSRETGQAIADYVTLFDETPDPAEPLVLFDPNAPWKKKTVENYELEKLLVPVFKNGRRVYDPPKLDEIQAYCAKELERLWDEVKRFEYPHAYYVDFSRRLYDMKQSLLMEME